MQWFIPLLLLGVSFTLWVSIAVARMAAETPTLRGGATGASQSQPRLVPADVAVVIPAHNEELGIAATVGAVLRLVPAGNVHVVADGCEDSTAALARQQGVHVLELYPGRGKAGGIEAALSHFDLSRHFAVLLIVDADTEVDEHYVERGLRLLEEDGMVALAGYARTTWRPDELSFVGRLLVAYRTRLYAVMQWMKYGQTWRHTNVTSIVPGFASMYRTAVLPRMDLNPPGLVIEDFNMTFELHHKRLGKIAFLPSVFAKTQDPDNLPDYYRQVTRWWLGFWQTLRRHKLWLSWFSAALGLFLLEVVLASVVLILIALAILLLALPSLTGGLILQWDWFAIFADAAAPLFSPINLLLFLFLPDYLLTCLAAIWTRRPSLLVYGLGFLPIRLIDATATLRTLPQAWSAQSNGQWKSPARRAIAAPADGAAAATPPAGPAGASHATATALRERTPSPKERRTPDRQRRPVLLDALIVGDVLLLAALSALALPLLSLLAAGILAVAGATVSSYRWPLPRPSRPGRPAALAVLFVGTVILALIAATLAGHQ